LQLNVPSIAISQLGFYDVLSSYGKPKKPLKKLHHCCCVWEEDSSFNGGDKGTLYPPGHKAFSKDFERVVEMAKS